MTNQIKQLDKKLDEIIKKDITDLLDYLVDTHTTTELHIMRRLLRQRRAISKSGDLTHYEALFHLAESVKSTMGRRIDGLQRLRYS